MGRKNAMNVRPGQSANVEVSLKKKCRPAARSQIMTQPAAEQRRCECGTDVSTPSNGHHGDLSVLIEKVDRIESLIAALAEQLPAASTAKEYYSTSEFAERVGRAEYTCRQWCLNERITAIKAAAGRGRFGEWLIAHDELQRYLNEGLLPLPRRRR